MRVAILGVAGLVLAGATDLPGPGETPRALVADREALAHGTCPSRDSLETDEGASAFYRIRLVPTGSVVGTAAVRGNVSVTFPDTPFDLALSPTGTFRRHLAVDLSGLRPPEEGGYVVWVTPPDLEPRIKLGTLAEGMRLSGEVSFSKFLVVVTLEGDPEGVSKSWMGPVVFRGLSRSGHMHTMAGHGPFQQEPCARYGF